MSDPPTGTGSGSSGSEGKVGGKWMKVCEVEERPNGMEIINDERCGK